MIESPEQHGTTRYGIGISGGYTLAIGQLMNMFMMITMGMKIIAADMARVLKLVRRK